MAVLTTGHTFVDGQQVTSTRLNNSVNAATFASAAVDGTTTQLSSGAIIVKDLGISTGKIAASAVTTAKLATDSVSTAKIIDSNVTKAKIEDFTNLTVLGNVSGSAATPAEVTIIDDDTMGTASATTLATSESVKAYVDTQIGANNDLSEVLANGNTTGANDIIVTAGQAITTDTVSETTADAGVTVDSLLIKDGGITAAGTSTFAGQTISDLGTVTTANIDGGSIDGTTVGASSASTGAFTTLTASDDVNFDSGTLFVDASANRVGIGTTSPRARMHVSGLITGGDDPSLGASTAPFYVSNTANSYGLNIGVSTSGRAWMQAQSNTLAISYDLLLNPLGGNVGIGTTSPATALDVAGTVTADGLTVDDGGSTSVVLSTNAVTFNRDAGASFIDQIGTGHISLRTTSSYATRLKINNNGDISFYEDTGTTAKFFWDASAESLGIGTTSPSRNLSIQDSSDVAIGLNSTGSAYSFIQFGTADNNSYIGIDNSSDVFKINNGSSLTSLDHFCIDTSGNVGIGTSSPSAKLDVEGESHIGPAGYQSVISNSVGNNSAIIRSSTGNLEFRGSSTDYYQLFLKSGGNVGIGTSSPHGRLNIQSSAAAQYLLNLDYADGTDGGGFYQSSSTGLTLFLKDSSSNTDVQIATEGDSYFNGGNVGIGTSSPSHKLEAKSASATTSVRINASDSENRSVFIESPNLNQVAKIGTSGTGNSLSIEVNSTERMRIDSSGNVGIGTTSPSVPLQVDATGEDGILLRNDSSNNLTPLIEVRGQRSDTNSSQACGGGLGLTRWAPNNQIVDGNSVGSIYFGGAHGATTADEANILYTASIKAEADETWSSASDMATDLVFRTGSTGRAYAYNQSYGDTEVMRITHEGRVGIGDSTPSYKLDVNGTGRFVNDLILDDDLVHNRTGSGAFPGYSAGTFGAVLEDGGSNGSTLYMSRKDLWALYLATDTTLNSQGDKVVVFADLNGQSGDQDNVVGDITITSTSTSYNESSDYRLKENEVTLADGIDRLKQLKPYRFNFKRDADTTVDGFFAHEVQGVVPEAVRGEKDAMRDQEYEVSPAVYDDDGELISERVMGTRSVPDYQGIDKSKLVPLLTAALQEAVAKIEALEARVQTLEG